MLRNVSDFEYAKCEGGICITSYNGTAADVVVPEEIDGFPVVAVKHITGTRSTKENMISLIIPNSVTTIGERACSCSNSLKKVTITNPATRIEMLAFANCISLTDVDIPSDSVKILNYVFVGCKSMNMETMKKIKAINKKAFNKPSIFDAFENRRERN